MPKTSQQTQAALRRTINKLVRLVASLIVELDDAKAQIARLKELEPGERFIEKAKRLSSSRS
jgi:hypothetical protein